MVVILPSGLRSYFAKNCLWHLQSTRANPGEPTTPGNSTHRIAFDTALYWASFTALLAPACTASGTLDHMAQAILSCVSADHLHWKNHVTGALPFWRDPPRLPRPVLPRKKSIRV